MQLNPEPGFVIKTYIESESENPKQLPGTKVFINVCIDKNVPLPEGQGNTPWSELIETGEATVPIVVSEIKEDLDAKDQFSIVCDCCIHPKVLRESIKNRNIKVLLITTCINLVEQQMTVLLSREFKLPKRTHKGILSKTIIRQENSVSNSMDSFARDLLANGEAPENLLDQRSPTKSRTPLIQELSSMDLDHDEASPQVTRRIFAAGPNHVRLDIDGLDLEDIEKKAANLTISGQMLQVGDTKINLNIKGDPVHAEAVYAKDTGRISVMIRFICLN